MVVSRRTVIALVAADVVLFVIADATSADAIVWWAWLLGLVLLIALGVRALVQARRRPAR